MDIEETEEIKHTPYPAIHRAGFALRQLEKKGVMESKVLGSYPDLNRVFRIIPEYLNGEKLNQKDEQSKESIIEQRFREGCNKVNKVMAEKGFTSMFERVFQTLNGKTAWILWVNIVSATMVLTFVNQDGSQLYYKCKEMFDFPNAGK